MQRVREAITAAGPAGTTFQALRESLGLSEGCVRGHVAALRKEGWLVEDNLDPEGPSAGRPRRILVDRRLR